MIDFFPKTILSACYDKLNEVFHFFLMVNPGKTHIPATPKEVQVTQLPLRLKGTEAIVHKADKNGKRYSSFPISS